MTLHQGGRCLEAGVPRGGARTAVVALHGRGATAEGILAMLVAELGDVPDVALLAPQARHGTWYPQSFLAPFAANEPWLGSALERGGELVQELVRDGLPVERIVLFGFSQGACLASEFTARHPRRYGGLVAAVGGRIGPPGTVFSAAGDLAGMPAYFGAGDPDPHVPWSRVAESAASLAAMGAVVTTERLVGFPHAVPPAAIDFARRLLLLP